MEANVLAAVRVAKLNNSNQENIRLHYEAPLRAVVEADARSFPCNFAFDDLSTQDQIYRQVVQPFMDTFLEGFDISICTYGQSGTGKSYSLYGHGVGCEANETDYGLSQRFIRDLFNNLSTKPERTFRISISWTEIYEDDEQVIDLLNNLGLIPCESMKDCFGWMQIGMDARNNTNHNIFTLILEQQWITDNGYNQHKLSTISFCDLCGSERQFIENECGQYISVPRNFSLQALESFIRSLVDPNNQGYIDPKYEKSSLPALLRDSFGGRARTVFLLCVSPLVEHTPETIFNLEFAYEVQKVTNCVFMNAFTDNNVPIENLYPPTPTETNFVNNNVNASNQTFAMQQCLKLIQNAEGLFNRIILTQGGGSLLQDEVQQIVEWLYLKAECDDCVNMNESSAEQSSNRLNPIEEIDECAEEAENLSDSDSEISHKMGDMDDTIEKLIEKFEDETDDVVELSYRNYLKAHPNPAAESISSLKQQIDPSGYTRERRRSIQPGSTLSSTDFAMLVSINQSSGSELMQLKAKAQSSAAESNLKKCQTNIRGLEKQISELKDTILQKEQIIRERQAESGTRKIAKAKLESEYKKTEQKLLRAVSSKPKKGDIEHIKKRTSDIERLERRTTEIEQSLRHLESNDMTHKLKKEMRDAKKLLEERQKELKKEKKRKEALEKELDSEFMKTDKHNNLTLTDGKSKIRDMSARIQNLEILLKEKSGHLENADDTDAALSLRHEIRNLRRTKDHLVQQRCCLNRKLKRDKSLSCTEERKLIECDEAIEAIDTAIELKNELICGRKSIDTDESLQREKGEQLLISRLNRLSVEEMRTMLYKYYQKVIDLKTSSRNLEIQLLEMERQKDAWEWREKVLTNAVHQARFEGEKNITLVQRQYETRMNLMLKHFANDTNASSSTLTDEMIGKETVLYNPHHPYLDSSSEIFGVPALKQDTRITQFNKYKTLDRIKDKEKDKQSNRFFAKFQVLTRYQGSDKKKYGQPESELIPQKNLKQLAGTHNVIQQGSTKVTRQRNKLILQQQD